MNRHVLLAAAVALAAPSLALAQDDSPRPEGWRVVALAAAPDTGIDFVRMPPGWHMTTGPGALLFDPTHRAEGNFEVEAEIFVFPSTGDQPFGIFLGGGDDPEASGYVAFLLRRDGSAGVEERGPVRTDGTALWRRATAAATPGTVGEGPAKNVLRVAAGPDSVHVTVNGAPVLVRPRAGMRLDGGFGFVVGEGVNLHVSRLDLLRHLAPPPEGTGHD